MEQRVQQALDLIKESVLKTVPAEAIYLFGSYAYGTPNEDSDLDIYVVVPDAVQENPLNIGVAIRRNLRGSALHFPMDLMVGTSSVFNRRRQEPTLQKLIAREGVLLYGR
ncbi:MAG: nucleotidyltransferase domain-containing protein [Oscillospiraceae bacterium]|jgi:predicted nucleotidyltransferase|nr:nucleotidyltransferase domain-containing protein [Oscillospiraceae bacterium]